MKYPIPDKPLDEEIIKKLIDGRIDPRLKALILLLTSSGLRLQEALTIKMRDISFDESPIRIMLEGQITKTGQAREAYMTRQAAEAMKALRRGPDDYVFSFMEGKSPKEESKQVEIMGEEGYRIYMAEKKAGQMLRRLVRSLELEEKVAEGHKFHKIHFHILRKYFYDIASYPKNVGPEYAHMLIGHKPYMGMYDLSMKEKLRALYREKLESVLTIGEVVMSYEDENDIKKRIERIENFLQETQSGVFETIAEKAKSKKKQGINVTKGLRKEKVNVLKVIREIFEKRNLPQYIDPNTLDEYFEAKWEEILKIVEEA